MAQPVEFDMGQLAFSSDDRLFDGKCVRFIGLDGRREPDGPVEIMVHDEDWI